MVLGFGRFRLGFEVAVFPRRGVAVDALDVADVAAPVAELVLEATGGVVVFGDGAMVLRKSSVVEYVNTIRNKVAV